MLSGDRSTTRGKERRTSMVIATLHSDIFKVMWMTRIPSHRKPTLARLVFPRFNGHWDCWERSTGNLKGGFIDKYRASEIRLWFGVWVDGIPGFKLFKLQAWDPKIWSSIPCVISYLKFELWSLRSFGILGYILLAAQSSRPQKQSFFFFHL